MDKVLPPTTHRHYLCSRSLFRGGNITNDKIYHHEPYYYATKGNCINIIIIHITTLFDDRALIQQDRRITVDQMTTKLNISHGTAWQIVTENLGMKKLCSRWISHVLTE